MGVLKAWFGALAFVGLFWLVLVGILETGGGTNSVTRLSPREGIGREKVADLNYMSKRRVPNGPDPIHNRRTGNSHQPPGQA